MSAGEVLDGLRRALDGTGPALVLGGADAGGVDIPEGTAVVLGTSGSTGVPKRVVLSGEALMASARATAGRVGSGRWLLALPPTSIAGLQVLTRSIVADTVPVMLDGPFDPRRFAAAMPGVAFTSLVPAQLVRLLDAGVDLSSFAAVLVGGQRLDPLLRARAADAGVRIVRTYGATETSGGCVYDGLPLDGVGVRVIDGEVQISGPMLASGYLGDERATDASFRRDADGVRWYRTGDAGSVDDGVLSVTGRVDDVYVSGGINVSVARVEAAVRTVPGLDEAHVVAVPDETWGEASVIVVPSPASRLPGVDRDRSDLSPLLAAARDAVAEAVGRHARPARIVSVAAIPFVPNGKPDRVALRDLAHDANETSSKA